MEQLLQNHYRNNHRRSAGLTLIEVLIALAIMGIAMTAVIKAATQNIRGTAYLQNKTTALWVGQNVMNSLRAGVIKLPAESDDLKESVNFLGADWYWQASVTNTPNPHIKKITVRVFAHAPETEESSLITLESYNYHD